MKKFNKIATINVLNLPKFAETELQNYSQSEISFVTTDSSSEDETISRIGEAEAALGSWNTTITPKVLDSCPNLKYIGICGTSLTYVNTQAAESRGIVVKNVIDYGDEATAEFIFARLLMLIRGFDKFKWDNEPRELNSKKFGIIGLGAVGRQVAKIALGFGMDVQYYSRTRNLDIENLGIKYTLLDELLSSSEIISLHVPRNLRIINNREFNLIKKGVILVNTSIGDVFDLDEFREWIKKGDNYAIIDNQSYVADLSNLPNCVALPITAGKTKESIDRLGNKVIENVKAYLSS